MNNSDIEIIEKYLKGQLAEEAKQKLENRIAIDEDFATEVALHQVMIEGIERFGLHELKKTTNEIDQELDQEGFFLTNEDMDAYLEGSMNKAQSTIFEERLANDHDFKKAFQLHELTTAGIKKQGTETEFSGLFQSIDKELQQEGFFETNNEKATETKPAQQSTKIKYLSIRNLAIAASVALILFAGWWAYQPKQVDTDVLYATHFQIPANQLSPLLDETGFVVEPYYEVLKEALEAYNNNDFTTAKARFERYRRAAPKDDEYYSSTIFYSAITALQLEDTKTAESLLLQIEKTSFPQQIEAKWYLALTFLKLNQKDKAIAQLLKIANPPFKQKAQFLLKELQ